MLPKQKKGEEFFTGHAALTSQTGDADLPLTTAPSNAAPSVVRITSSSQYRLSILLLIPLFLFRLSPEKILRVIYSGGEKVLIISDPGRLVNSVPVSSRLLY
ncbi:hypothetical protein TNCT_364861 [Trichonephila clavata]|uniref:Uncharacterized protein n=1 Tax=Trichonephila clavata TaxID=2740835 RepID=A0A8X6FHQ2_TRICU|nr:hypothetical protein TNCT_364861 [Trichonephila clavata]